MHAWRMLRHEIFPSRDRGQTMGRYRSFGNDHAEGMRSLRLVIEVIQYSAQRYVCVEYGGGPAVL